MREDDNGDEPNQNTLPYGNVRMKTPSVQIIHASVYICIHTYI
jgi:hypothetical protein